MARTTQKPWRGSRKRLIKAIYRRTCANRPSLPRRPGRRQDYAKAPELFKKAADQGYADAELELGWFYENGLGEDRNNDRAKVWYQKAADQGNSGAQAALQGLAARNTPASTTERLRRAKSWSPV